MRHKVFLALWCGGLATGVGLWMQNLGAAWLMTTLTESPLLIALVQTATTLPAFLFGLPGGVLADLVDRRRLLLATSAWMAVSVGVLSVLTLFGGLTPWTLLLLTFSVGVGSALQAPAWQSAPSEVLHRSLLPTALALLSVSGNGARALGPAMAGILIASLGTGAVFVATTLCFCVVVGIVARLRIPARRGSNSPPESLLGGMQSGIRYIRHSHAVRGQILRVFAAISCASALFALLPVVARNQLGLGAAGYGLLSACLGGGAVLGAFFLARLQERFAANSIVAVAIVQFAVATLCLAYVRVPWVACGALVAAGSSWMAMGALPNAAVQTSLPAWVRARAVAVFLLAFQASLAVGAIAWGALATHIGVSHALAISAVMIVLSLAYARRHPVRMGSEAEVTPSMHWAEPVVAVEPEPEDGPVAVQVEYRIDAARRTEFAAAAHALATIRKRDGAQTWRLYKDLSDPSRYIERFIVESWAEYQRQQARATMADKLAEERVRAFHIGAPPRMLHFIMEPDPRG